MMVLLAPQVHLQKEVGLAGRGIVSKGSVIECLGWSGLTGCGGEEEEVGEREEEVERGHCGGEEGDGRARYAIEHR